MGKGSSVGRTGLGGRAGLAGKTSDETDALTLFAVEGVVDRDGEGGADCDAGVVVDRAGDAFLNQSGRLVSNCGAESAPDWSNPKL